MNSANHDVKLGVGFLLVTNLCLHPRTKLTVFDDNFRFCFLEKVNM